MLSRFKYFPTKNLQNIFLIIFFEKNIFFADFYFIDSLKEENLIISMSNEIGCLKNVR